MWISLLAQIEQDMGKMKFHYQNIYQSSIQLIMSASNHHDRYLPWASENKYAT